MSSQTTKVRRADAKVWVRPLAVEGKLSNHWRRELGKQVISGLRRGEFRLFSDKDQPGEVQYTITSKIVVEVRDYDIDLRITDRNGEVVARSMETCELCGVGEVADMLSDQVAALSVKLDQLVLGPPMLSVESTPEGAKVVLDGEVVGVAPLQRRLTPGAHHARVTKDGYISQEIRIDAVSGIHESISFEMQRMPAGAPARSRQGMLIAGWTLTGLGIAAVAVGATLVAIHRRPYQTRCHGVDVDLDGDCRFRYRSRLPGVVSLSVGGAALIAGVVLVVLDTTRRGAAKKRRVTAGGPGQVAMTVRF